METCERIEGWDKIVAKGDTQLGSVQIIRGSWDHPHDLESMSNHHHLQLNLEKVPGGTKGCFVDCWSSDRFAQFGPMFFLPANRKVRFKSNCRQQKSIVCRLVPSATAQWIGCDLELSDSELASLLDVNNSRVRCLLSQAGKEISNPGFASDSMLELIISQIVIELARHFRESGEVDCRGVLSSWQLRQIEQRVAEMTSQPTLVELADLCSLSVRHLTRAFRKSTGATLGDYIANKRLEHARNLLVSGLSIKSVAYSMGFSAPSNFTTSFTRMTGQTPSDFRKKYSALYIDEDVGKSWSETS